MGTFVVPSFEIPGVVVETRELKTKDQKTTWAFAVKLMAMGGTFELTTKDEKVWKEFGEGQEVVAVGRFENFNGKWQFVVTGRRDRGKAAA